MLRTLIFTIITSVFLTSCALESTEPVLDRSLATLPVGTKAKFQEFRTEKQLTATAKDNHYLIRYNDGDNEDALYFYDIKTLGSEFSRLQSYGVNYILEYVNSDNKSYYLMAHVTDRTVAAVNPVPSDQVVDEINEIKSSTITKGPGEYAGYLITSKAGLETALNVIITHIGRERIGYYLKVD